MGLFDRPKRDAADPEDVDDGGASDGPAAMKVFMDALKGDDADAAFEALKDVMEFTGGDDSPPGDEAGPSHSALLLMPHRGK